MKTIVYKGEHTFESKVKENIKGHDTITIFSDETVEVVRYHGRRWDSYTEEWVERYSTLNTLVRGIEKIQNNHYSVAFEEYITSPWTDNEYIYIHDIALEDVFPNLIYEETV